MNVHGYEVCRFGRIYEILVNVTFLHDIRVLIYSSVGLTICFVAVIIIMKHISYGPSKSTKELDQLSILLPKYYIL